MIFTRTYNKLVRDNILKIIRGGGKLCTHHIASDDEYESKLKEKLYEEIEEFYENPCETEMGDILEVLNSLMKFYDLKPDKVEEARLAKLSFGGGFSKKIILEEVE